MTNIANQCDIAPDPPFERKFTLFDAWYTLIYDERVDERADEKADRLYI